MKENYFVEKNFGKGWQRKIGAETFEEFLGAVRPDVTSALNEESLILNVKHQLNVNLIVKPYLLGLKKVQATLSPKITLIASP